MPTTSGGPRPLVLPIDWMSTQGFLQPPQVWHFPRMTQRTYEKHYTLLLQLYYKGYIVGEVWEAPGHRPFVMLSFITRNIYLGLPWRSTNWDSVLSLQGAQIWSLVGIEEGDGTPLQCPCLENPRDGGAWWAAVCGVAQSRTWLKRLSSRSRRTRPSPVAQTVKGLPAMRETRVHSLGREDLLEKEMATHSSILAWKIPWTEKPGGL